MSTVRDLLREAYEAFNARDIDRALAAMHPDVEWPNGMEGGTLHGHDAVRSYWTRQWGTIDPQVAVLGFATDALGNTVAHVHQVVRDLAGNVLSDQMVQHVYVVREGLVERMEIKESSPPHTPRSP